jgi:hypothetical protein
LQLLSNFLDGVFFKFKILGEYIELYKKLKAEQPGVLELERARVRKI